MTIHPLPDPPSTPEEKTPGQIKRERDDLIAEIAQRLTTGPLNVHEAIIAVMGDIGAVAKTRYNEGQKFNFRGIDNFLNAVHPVMVRHGLTIVPKTMDHEFVHLPRINDKGQTYGMTTQVFLKVTWEATGPDGSQTTFQTIGESADTFDKATNKSISAAEKYMLISVFKIPTEDMSDGDADNPDMGGQGTTTPPRQGQRGQRQSTPPKPPAKDDEGDTQKPTKTQLDNIGVLANEVIGTNTAEIKAVMMAITDRVAVRSHMTFNEAVKVISTLGKIRAGELVLVQAASGVKIYPKGEEPFDAAPDGTEVNPPPETSTETPSETSTETPSDTTEEAP